MIGLTRRRLFLWGTLATGLAGCGSSRAPATAQGGGGPARCIEVEVQNTSLRGVTVWVEWENAVPRRMGRLSLSARRVYELRFRNAQLNLRFQSDGATQYQISNAVLPTPGDRIDIVYGVNGPGVLRRIGVADC